MVLVDTSVWVEHLRRRDSKLAKLLADGEVLCHPFVIGELACGSLRARREILALLAALPSLETASNDAVLEFIERQRLSGKGLGWVDLHLLAACARARVALWTLDKRLGRSAAALGLRHA